MKKLTIYDPAMCCSTGVCGVDIDPVLAQFAADLKWVADHGVAVERYNLGQEPQAFAANEAVVKIMEQGMDMLPVTMVDGKIIATGVHPTRQQLAQKLELALDAQSATQAKSGSCCSPKSGCC